MWDAQEGGGERTAVKRARITSRCGGSGGTNLKGGRLLPEEKKTRG